ncbi:MAG: cytochrome [Bdellovibrionales bacterium]
MYLQGSLQLVFDALFTIGAIDPVLKMDWEQVTQQMKSEPQKLKSAFQKINGCGSDLSLIVNQLKSMDDQSVHFVALEVARELSEFQDRKILH